MIALIAVGLTQNKPLPENIKVTLCVCGGGRVGGKGGYGRSEHTGGVEVLAAQEKVNIYWARRVKWKWMLILEEGMP